MNVPHLYSYRNGEYIQYMRDVLTFLEPHDVQALKLDEQQKALAAIVTTLNTAYKQPQNSEFTPEVVALDERRDKAVRGIKKTIDTALNHFNPSRVAAANLLNRNLEAHGSNIPLLPYQEETAVIYSLLEDWETQQPLAAAVTTLNLGEWLTELKESNALFSDKYRERVNETSENPSVPLSDFRKQATQAYRDLINHINAHATLKTSPIYTSLLNQVDVLAEKYNQTVENRTGTTNNTDPEPPTEPNPNPNPDDTSF